MVEASMSRVLVTGSKGFIGKNLVVQLNERADTEVLSFSRSDPIQALVALVSKADAIVHLAGENRPSDVADFARVNTDLTHSLCEAVRASGRKIPLILASSTQAEYDNPYGKSKLEAERAVERLAQETENPVCIYRLPGVFGKWCKPNYNSVVATFCHNIARNLPVQINDPSAVLPLVYVDDVIDQFSHFLNSSKPGLQYGEVIPEYSITLHDLAEQIYAFQNCRTTLMSERVGAGLTRALYSTYVSYLPPEQFAYDLPEYGDERGTFVEMLKTPDCGQFSLFTVHPGITRGSHYHHSKSEKFLVVKGTVCMRFRHIVTGETCEMTMSGNKPQVIDSIPGWAHDVTNIGDSEAIVMLWANEVFDRERPDCINCQV
jgi:UDP-2-acetamido-2,6-beta-L-arabino-hexul-4-ose reductase